MTLESLVRPFARPDTLSRRRIVTTRAKVEVTPAVISWGVAGSISAPYEIAAIDPLLVAVVLRKKHDEFTEPAPGMLREEETIRVENPDDPGQYVMVKRIKRISFRKPADNPIAGARGAGTQENVHADGTRDYGKTSVDYVEVPAEGYTNVGGKVETVRYNLASE